MEESLPMAINIGLHACQVEALPAHDRHRPPQTRSPRGECRYMRQSGGMLGESVLQVNSTLKSTEERDNVVGSTAFTSSVWHLRMPSGHRSTGTWYTTGATFLHDVMTEMRVVTSTTKK